MLDQCSCKHTQGLKIVMHTVFMLCIPLLKCGGGGNVLANAGVDIDGPAMLS